MSGEALKQEIRKTAEERAQQALADARAKADIIIAEADQEARNIAERKVRDAKRRIEQMKRSETARARMECTKSLLNLQSQYVEEAFREAELRVTSLPASDPELYKSVLTHLVFEAFERLNRTRLIAVVRDSDRALLESILKDLNIEHRADSAGVNYSISSESLHASGGILIHSENMRVYYVNTFESRFLNSREGLRAKVAEALLNTKE